MSGGGTQERDQHLFGAGPKRLLALAGGGTLGVIELAFLAHIEALLRARHGDDPAFRLCDYFDMIGGTSIGAIIAAGLATGMTVAEITRRYLDLGPRAFRRHRWRITGLLPRYDAAPLTQVLRAQFGEMTLDSAAIRTGLLLVAHARAYGLGWKLGPERLLPISLGAGQYRRGLYGLRAPRLAGTLAFKALMDQVADGQQLTLTLLQWFSEPALPWPINSEIGDLAGDVLDRRPLLAFQRYDMRLEVAWLAERLREPPAAADLLRLRAIDNPAAMPRLHALAGEIAATQVQPAHFPAAFDVAAA